MKFYSHLSKPYIAPLLFSNVNMKKSEVEQVKVTYYVFLFVLYGNTNIHKYVVLIVLNLINYLKELFF